MKSLLVINKHLKLKNMKKTLLLVNFLLLSFVVFSQNLFFDYTNKYFEMECDRYDIVFKEDINKIYFIEDINIVKKIEIKECGEVDNHRKYGFWTGVNEQNEIICHRFYGSGYLKYDIMYKKNKIYAIVNYNYIYRVVDFDIWLEEEENKDKEGNYDVCSIIFYTEEGEIKSQYYRKNGEYIEKTTCN